MNELDVQKYGPRKTLDMKRTCYYKLERQWHLPERWMALILESIIWMQPHSFPLMFFQAMGQKFWINTAELSWGPPFRSFLFEMLKSTFLRNENLGHGPIRPTWRFRELHWRRRGRFHTERHPCSLTVSAIFPTKTRLSSNEMFTKLLFVCTAPLVSHPLWYVCIWQITLEVGQCFPMAFPIDGKKSLIFAQCMRAIMKTSNEIRHVLWRSFINGIKRSHKFRSPSECPCTTSINVPVAFPKHRRI